MHKEIQGNKNRVFKFRTEEKTATGTHNRPAEEHFSYINMMSQCGPRPKRKNAQQNKTEVTYEITIAES